jgi:hypothetical protein
MQSRAYELGISPQLDDAKDGAVARLSYRTSLLYETTDEWPALILIAATDLMLQKSIMENG